MCRMKMSGIVTLILCSLFLFFNAVSYGHEVWIEVSESDAGTEAKAELEVSLFWGHFPDDLDAVEVEAYELSVRRPDGEVEELELEPDEKKLSASYLPPSHGQYVFWAVRRPSTFAPADGPLTLSIQTAKAVYDVPAFCSTEEPVEKAIEIVPKSDMKGFKGGYAEFKVLLDGQPAPDAAVNLYGTDGTELSESSDQDGIFGFDIPPGRRWLVKANLREEDTGEVDGDEYEAVSRTATLCLTSEEAPLEAGTCKHCQAHHGDQTENGHTHSHGHDHDHGHSHDHGQEYATDFWKNAAVFIAGFLVGGAGVLFVLGMEKRG